MDEGIELIVKNLIGMTIKGDKWDKFNPIIEGFERDTARKGLALDVNEQQIKEIFEFSSQKVGKLVGSERNPSLTIASTPDEWADIVISKEPVPEELLPYMHIVKPVILGNYNLNQVNLLETKDVASLLFFSKVLLPSNVHNASVYEGATYNGVVHLNYKSIVRTVTANYLTQIRGKKASRYFQRQSQKYANGYIKYLTAHEAAHDHLWELNNRNTELQQTENMLGGLRLIYNLGKGLTGIGSYRDTIPPGFSEREALTVLIFSDLHNKIDVGSLEQVNEELYRPAPPIIRSSFAKYHNEIQIPTTITTSIIESASDLVAELALADDEDYRFYKRNKSQRNTNSSDYDAYTLARPFLDGLHKLVGNEMFSLLKVDPTPEEFKSPELYLANVSN